MSAEKLQRQGESSPGGKIIQTEPGKTFAGLGMRPVDPLLPALPVQLGARITQAAKSSPLEPQ